MDIKLKTDKFSYLKTVCYKNVVREENFEYIIPDPMPDASEVTAVCGTMLLRSKDPRRGVCEVTASAELSWIYTSPDDKTVHSLESSIPVTYKVEGSDIGEECLVIAVPEFISCEARVISSRKVLFKLNSLCRVFCYVDKEVIIPEVPEENMYECDSAEYKVDIIKAADEKPFELSSNFPVPNGRAAEILFWESRISALKASFSGRKLTFSGKMKLAVAYRDGDNDTPAYIEHEETFSQLLDCPYESVNYLDVQVAATSAYVTNEPGLAGDGKSIGFDMGFIIQYVLGSEVNIKCLKDMYGTTCKVACDYAQAKIECTPHEVEIDINAVGNIKTSPEVQNFLACSATVYPLSSRENNGMIYADGYASVIWKDASGGIFNKYMRVNSEPFKLDDGYKVSSCFIEDALVTPISGGCEVRIPTSVHLSQPDYFEMVYVYSAEKNESDPEAASLWVTRAAADTPLWMVGKKHGVSVEAIRNSSGLDSTGEPEPGTLLVIPKF